MRRLIPILAFAAAVASAGPVAAELRLTVNGDGSALEDDLRAASRLVALGEPSEQTAQDVIAAARSDYSRLVAALYERGYFGPVVSIRLDGREAADLSPFRGPASVRRVEITVDPGRPFRLGQADIGPLAPRTNLPDGFAAGAPANTPVLRRAAEAGIAGWRDAGHAAAAIADQRITARQADAELDVDIRLDPGPVAQFGTLIPSGQERMREDRIRRIAGLPEGQQFDPATLDRVAGRLRDTGAFTSVGLNEQPIGPDGTLDVEAELVEAPLRRLGFGAELSSQDGVGLSAYWLHRNLFGGAERLRLDAEVSGLGGENGGYDALLSAHYSRPASLTPDTTLEFGVTLEHLDEVTFTDDRIALSAGLSHWFSETLDGSIAAELSHSQITDAFSSRSVTILSLPGSLTWDNRDDMFDPRGGAYADLGLAPFAMEGGNGGVRLDLDARGYLGFGETDATRLAARLQLGTVDGGSVATLPPDWLYFSGGAGTVRGQSYQSLGALQGGVRTGGRSFAGLSLEMRQDIIGNWGAALFADAGMITTDAYWGGASGWHSGGGIGIRYDTPVGPIRFDLATPLDGANAGRDVFFYIGIGQAF